VRQADAALERTRAFVKIQDGCSFSCAFCVIPLVRGGTRSRRAAAVLAEIERRVAQGHREVVLTGVNLGCFRDREAGLHAAALVREAGSVPGVERLRLSSIEVNHLTTSSSRAARDGDGVAHLHVPLQSGDDGVLRAMGRRYTAAQYLAKLEPLDDFNLTADVIVGFPGEDERRSRARSTSSSAPAQPRPRLPVLAAPGTVTPARTTFPRREEGARRAPPRALGRALAPSLESRSGRPIACSSTGPVVGTATTTRRGSSTATSASSCTPAPSESPRRGSLPSPPEDCLFCRLVAEGDHVHAADGFVAIRDINPIAETHLLVLPERHVDTFRDVERFSGRGGGADAPLRRRDGGRGGPRGLQGARQRRRGRGQTIFHLHWHVLGRPLRPRQALACARAGDRVDALIAASRTSSRRRGSRATRTGATR
jgi:diadenosine tetraphosphate (Ap4A) HIT family hydrolase